MHKKKKSHFEYRLDSCKYKLNRLFKFQHHKQTNTEQEFEENCTHIINHIENYGFNFFPSHYVKDEIESLERMIDNFSV